MLQQKPETIEALLKFLIYLVLHKEEVEVDEESAEKTRKSLLELLKTDDMLRERIFESMPNQKEKLLSIMEEEEDPTPQKQGRIPMHDPLEEAKLRAKNLNIELEF